MTHLEKSSSERKKSSSVIYHKVDTHGHNEGKITATKIQNKISEFFIMLPIVNILPSANATTNLNSIIFI